jgi:hypothetical protein
LSESQAVRTSAGPIPGCGTLTILATVDEPRVTTSCVSQAGSTVIGDLTITISPVAQCQPDLTGILRIDNIGNTVCTSDVNAMIGTTPIMFESQSGFGGERGFWRQRPPGQSVSGVNQYLSGQHQWPILLPSLPAGAHEWTYPNGITCGAETLNPTIRFSTRS